LIFDAYIDNKYAHSSIPISLIIIFIVVILNINYLIKDRLFLILIISSVFFLSINILIGSNRAIINFFGMMIPISTYLVFKYKFRDIDYLYDCFYTSLVIVFLSKLFSDILNFNKILDFHFISEYIVIYNFRDYFPFFYFIIIILSIYNIEQKKKIYLSIIIILLSFIIIPYSYSRLYIYTIYFIPIMFLVFKIVKIKVSVYYTFLFIFCIAMTFILAFNWDVFSDQSLSSRFKYWYDYFLLFEPVNIVLPMIGNQQYRSTGSMHNEFLELFRYFGVLIVGLFYYITYKMLNNTIQEFKIYSLMIMFIILLGGLIQINYTNPYVGILIGTVLGIFSRKKKVIS
jgi:hypothetical protein